jgi:iron(III) transport system permease protein
VPPQSDVHRKRAALSAAPSPLAWIAAVLMLVSLLPVAALLTVAFTPQWDLWRHLAVYVLPYAARDTLLLLGGVSVVAGTIGIALASLVSFTDFPGRRFLAAAAILPLAFPIYLHAFVYVELLDAAGPVELFLRRLLGPGTWLGEIRSLPGAIAIFSLVLYPYIYLPLVLAFSAQPRNFHDVARTLGHARWSVFFRVQLPAARPAFVSGLALALMEALADFGASEYLGVRTFAYTVYSTWVTRDSLSGAAQIAVILVFIVASLTIIEAFSRRAAAYYSNAGRSSPLTRKRLRGFEAWAASGFCLTVVAVAFGIPAAFLVYAAAQPLAVSQTVAEFLLLFRNTLFLAVAGASVIAAAAMALSLLQRWERSGLIRHTVQVCTVGYAIPGVVLAIGALFAFSAVDNAIDALFRSSLGTSSGLLITGTPIILILAYLARFLAVGHGPIQSRLLSVPTNHDEVARTLGRSPGAVAFEVLAPQLRATFAAAWLLLAVDILKELPMTLLLRPIGIETFATSLYGHASRGQFEDGSLEALAILLSGILAVLVMQKLVVRTPGRYL